jgi:hypothetical protein
MDIKLLLADKQLKAKDKVELISKLLLDKKISIDELLNIAKLSKDPERANCIEAIEFATKIKPGISSTACFDFVTENLLGKAPRIKWESAKVIGNIAHLYPNKLDGAIKNLLTNSEYPGTVVRWSAAFALGEIVKLKTKRNKDLIPAIESIIKREEKNSIRNIYLEALKVVGV